MYINTLNEWEIQLLVYIDDTIMLFYGEVVLLASIFILCKVVLYNARQHQFIFCAFAFNRSLTKWDNMWCI